MKLGDILEFRKDLYFDGAVQADWFYHPEKSKLVAESFVFHGRQYYGVDNTNIGVKKRIDTVSFVEELGAKLLDDRSNPLTLAIADYGTGKSHLAVALSYLYSGKEYKPGVYDKIIDNISSIDNNDATRICSQFDGRNFVIVLNGMRDFNLHSELLKTVQRSLSLYGLSDELLHGLNRAVDTAERFFLRNSLSSLSLFEQAANEKGWLEKGQSLIEKLQKLILVDDSAFSIVNEVYAKVNGQEIQWDEGISAASILETLVSELCGMNGKFDHIVVIFDEFGRYLEYASGLGNPALSGESALQQMFEASQNAEGALQIVSFIQRDIKAYLNTVDKAATISRYIGRFDASDKYYISSNLETVFANLIKRKNKKTFEEEIVSWQNSKENEWKEAFNDINRWLITVGLWKSYAQFRKVIVEGIYPLHPISTYMLTHLSDYLQNRSSLTLVSNYISDYSDSDLNNNPILIMPEQLMRGDLYNEMLSAEQDGRQASQHCLRFDNIICKYGDKLPDNAKTVLRANLILRILRFRTESYDDVKKALIICTGLSREDMTLSLDLLENEYGYLAFDERANCLDFMEESNGAHDFKIIKKRLIAGSKLDKSIFEDIAIREMAGVVDWQTTNFGVINHISTNEWNYEQELYAIDDFTTDVAEEYVTYYMNATSSIEPKGRLVWLYLNKNFDVSYVDRAEKIAQLFDGKPILIMLMNDKDNRLYNALLEYSVLSTMDESIQHKYDRHYKDAIDQAKTNLGIAFEELKKERIRISKEGEKQLEGRLANSLMGVFEKIYPLVIPFPFDGFIAKNNKFNGKGVSYYCSIIKMLLSNTVSYDNIHNFQSDIRNRIEALLMSNNNSWKCINENYQVVPPENERVRKIYDEISSALSDKREVLCNEVFVKLNSAPFGLSDEIVTMVLAVLCTNMNYCIRIRYKGELLSINNWAQLVVVKDKKIEFDVIKASALEWVDAGEVEEKYIHLFEKIERNRRLSEVNGFIHDISLRKQADAVPETLETRLLLAEKILDDGLRAEKEWGESLGAVEDKMDEAEENNQDIYNSLEALELLKKVPIDKIFSYYTFDDEHKNILKQQNDAIIAYLDQHMAAFISNLHCVSVTRMQTFENHCKRIERKLQDLGFDRYARNVRSVAEKEMSNIEEIRSRENLKKDFESFMKEHVDRLTTYEILVRMSKEGTVLLERVNKYATAFGTKGERYVQELTERLNDINGRKERIDRDISDVWDNLDELGDYESIDYLNDDISSILQKGLRSSDSKSLQEVQEKLQDLKRRLSEFEAKAKTRRQAKILFEEITSTCPSDDMGFDASKVIQDVYDNIVKKLDKEENNWKSQHLSLGDESREAVHRWKDSISYLPEYLSDETRNEVNELNIKAERIISEGKIEDVEFYFNKLDTDERIMCLKRLNGKYSND